MDASDVAVRLSTTAGSAGDSEASTPAASLGKYMSTTAVVDATLQNLLRNIDAAEAEDGITIYRCVFFYNSSGDVWADVLVWIASQISGGGDVTIGLDPAGVSAHDSASAQAAEISDEEEAPAGVAFTRPASEIHALAVGDVAGGECFAVWLKLTVLPGASALWLDNAVLHVKGDASL